MKKITLFLLLVTSLYSEAKVYLGVGSNLYNEKFINANDAQSFSYTNKIKIGYGDINRYAFEISLDKVKNESNLFSKDDSDKYGINVELIKAFNLNLAFNPFFKGGFGAGYMNIDRTLQDRLYYGSFNFGLGLFIPINKYSAFEVAYEYKRLTYEGIDVLVDNISYKSNLNSAYLGLNIYF